MARKSKEFRELFYQDSVQPARISHSHTRSEKESEAFKNFKSTLRSQPENEGKIFVTNPKGRGKMSEKLMKFVLPYLDETDSNEERESLFNIAVLAWNLALLTRKEWQEFLDNYIFDSVNPLDRESLEMLAHCKNLIEELIERKLKFFANEKRSIEAFQLIEDDDELRVMVTSSLD